MNYPKRDQEEALQRLHALLKPGDTVYTKLNHVSRSGMSRNISCYVIRDNEPIWISWAVSRVLGAPLADDDGVKVGGAGMDMGFHVVSSLSRILYPDGFGCIGETLRKRDNYAIRCPSNDHSNGDRDYTKHTKRAPHWHKSGDYALEHRWLS